MRNLRSGLFAAMLVSGLSFGTSSCFGGENPSEPAPAKDAGTEGQSAITEALKKAGLSAEEVERVQKSLEQVSKVPMKGGNNFILKAETKKVVNGDGVKSKETNVVSGATEFAGGDYEVIDLSNLADDENIVLRINRGQLDSKEQFRIGVQCKVSKDESATPSVVIESVLDGSPAAKAGLKKEDVILKVGSQAIASVEELVQQVQATGEQGKELTIEVKREGETLTVTLTPDRLDMAESLAKAFAIPFAQLRGGWIVNGPNAGDPNAHGLVPPNFPGLGPSNEELSKDIKRLEKEILELKAMIKAMAEK